MITPADASLPLHRLLDQKAAADPNAVFVRYLADGEENEHILRIGELAERSRQIAGGLRKSGLGGRPVLVAAAPGPAFVEALFACWHAGAIAVPVHPPKGSRHRLRFESVAADCGAGHAFVTDGVRLPGSVMALHPDTLAAAGAEEGCASYGSGPCLLQYTSGSTAAPKGVMLSHANLRAHHAALSIYQHLGIRSILTWLPAYHDMGLVLKILHAFEEGIPLVWMNPDHFIQRPTRWIKAISRYRAEMSGGPNFAFEAVLRSIRDEDLEGIDLSCWKAAPCGAERIRADTLERFATRLAANGFRREAFLPGYGLAESTLIVTAHRAGKPYETCTHPDAGSHVSCGRPLAGVEIRICDPLAGTPVANGAIGEIRVRAPVVAAGYWQREEETRETFDAGDQGLKTGDLGFIDDGRLFVTGRMKDLIIADGVNIAPEDIEAAVMKVLPEVQAAAAFPMDDGCREGVILVIEATRSANHQRLAEVARSVTGTRVGVALSRCLVVRPGVIPRTTSGKIRRSACRDVWQDGRFDPYFDDTATVVAISREDPLVRQLLKCACEVTGQDRIRVTDDWFSLGFGSLDAARLAGRIEERLGVRVPIGQILASRSFGDLAEAIEPLPPRRAFDGILPIPGAITHSQERMWFLHEFDSSSPAYHVFGAVELTGPLDAGTLAAAFDVLVARHGMLRSRHGERDGRPTAWITDEDPPRMVTAAAACSQDARRLLETFARRTFRLADEPPVRALLFRISEEHHVLGVCAHHIAMDGWSLRILSRELAQAYHMLHDRLDVRFEHAAPDFIEYAARHRAWIDSGAIDSQIAFWKRRLEGHPGVISLPTDFPRPARPAFEGGLVSCVIPADLCELVDQTAVCHRATPFMIQLAAFLLLLRQHGAGDDLIAAVPVANRHLAGAGDFVGTLVNTLPFRLVIDPEESFSGLLARVRAASIEMQEHQDAPFERIIEALSPSRSLNHAPLAQVMFDHQEIPVAQHWPDGLSCKPFSCHRGGSQFDLSLLVHVFSDHRQVAIEYRTDLFLPHTARMWLDRYLQILQQACEQPEMHLRSLAALPEQDRVWLDRFTHGPERPGFPATTTPDLISRRVVMHPERPAVHDGMGFLDYRTLEEQSGRIAAALRKFGIGAGGRVAVLLERNRELPAVLWGVWRTGAAYVPLDPSNPPARIAMILEDVQPATVVASLSLAAILPPGVEFIPSSELSQGEAEPASEPEIAPSTPAYVIHTSGSTGRPKGVVVSHGALANFLQSMAEIPGFTEADHLLAVTTVSFDISLLELFLPLTCGGSLTVVPTTETGDGQALVRLLAETGASVMQATPATWRILLEAGWRGWPSIKILCGGEAMDPQLARKLVELGTQVWNLYGPTETTVWSAVWRVPQDATRIRIGRPIANTGLHVLLADGSPAPPGVPGGLWISGQGLAEGYWNSPDLTTQRFRVISDHRGQAVPAYGTGDIARWHADGSLECLGREDHQVKIRGFRVELGEIECALGAHPEITQARAALRGAPPDRVRLVAWFTCHDHGKPPETAALKQHLAGLLPAHMIPSEIGHIGAFPLGASGKVDLSCLEDPVTPGKHAEMLSDTERRLLDIWSDLLERPDIHPTDDWFLTGGHSLLALRLFGRIHADFRKRLPLASILENRTLRELAALIDRTPGEQAS